VPGTRAAVSSTVLLGHDEDIPKLMIEAAARSRQTYDVLHLVSPTGTCRCRRRGCRPLAARGTRRGRRRRKDPWRFCLCLGDAAFEQAHRVPVSRIQHSWLTSGTSDGTRALLYSDRVRARAGRQQCRTYIGRSLPRRETWFSACRFAMNKRLLVVLEAMYWRIAPK